MSEHMSIKGKVIFHHLPYDCLVGLAFCHRCKKVIEKAVVNIDEGCQISLVCGYCKKTIWVLQERCKRKLIYDDVECVVCGKPTNWYDASSIQIHPRPYKYLCSLACEEKHQKEVKK